MTEKELIKYISNHRMCAALMLQYLDDMLTAVGTTASTQDFTEQLVKHQPGHQLGAGFTGRTWITWFLRDFAPRMMDEAEKVVEKHDVEQR